MASSSLSPRGTLSPHCHHCLYLGLSMGPPAKYKDTAERTSGTADPLPEQSAQTRYRAVWARLPPSLEGTEEGRGLKVSLASGLQRVRAIFQPWADKYKCSLVACGAKPHPSKKWTKFQLSANAKIINWINKATATKHNMEKNPAPAVSQAQRLKHP